MSEITIMLDDIDTEPGKAAPEENPVPEPDRVMEAWKRMEASRPKYPLSLTKEECLKMGSQVACKGYRYFRDSFRDGEYELAEDPGKEAWDRDGMKAFMEGRPCPVCRGSYEKWVVYRGTKTNFFFRYTTKCKCAYLRWMRRMLDRKLPPSLRHHNLNLLRPSPLSRLTVPFQEREIEFLKQHWYESFFFLGPPGSSKSTFAAALFRAALWWDCHHGMGGFLWRIDGNHLFESEVEYATADDKSSVTRDITVDDIYRARRRGFTPVLVLEEIDKRRMTEFAANVLFRLVNAMDECHGQLIITTNLTRQGFKDLFMESDVEAVRVDGGALLRRIVDNMNVRDYHQEE